VKFQAVPAGWCPLQSEECKSFWEQSIKDGNKLRKFYLFFPFYETGEQHNFSEVAELGLS